MGTCGVSIAALGIDRRSFVFSAPMAASKIIVVLGAVGLAALMIAAPRMSSNRSPSSGSSGPAASVAAPAAAACPADAKKANLNFTLKNLDGKPVKLSDYAGKVVLLDFWATWCAPCKVEIPFFIDLYASYSRVDSKSSAWLSSTTSSAPRRSPVSTR